MSKLTRCPFCGGLNPVEADWCGQCLVRFTEPGVEYGTADEAERASEDEDAEEDDEPPSPVAAEATVVARARGNGSVPVERGAFKASDAGISWTCLRCETENPIELDECPACGAALADTLRPAPAQAEKDPGTAALLSLFFPGAGHAYLGLWGQGVTRAILSVWAIIVAVFTVLEGTGGPSNLVAGTFAAAALALWVVAAHDAYREASTQTGRALLRGRRFLWVVTGLLMALVIMLTLAGVSASR